MQGVQVLYVRILAAHLERPSSWAARDFAAVNKLRFATEVGGAWPANAARALILVAARGKLLREIIELLLEFNTAGVLFESGFYFNDRAFNIRARTLGGRRQFGFVLGVATDAIHRSIVAGIDFAICYHRAFTHNC